MPNSICDLHMHTNYSDGRASPGELLRYAAQIGLKAVAITDHENAACAQEAAHVAAQVGLELVPGIEMSARWDNCPSQRRMAPDASDVDVLGYFIDPDDAQFQAFTAAALQDMQQRVADCCRRLTAAGYAIEMEDVRRENPRYPGAMPCIRALTSRGHASNFQEAHQLFMAYWQDVRAVGPSLPEVIDAIHAAGGVAVLAHPIAVACDGELLDEARLAQLVDWGLDGIEILHPRLDREARLHFALLAREFNLIMTGGSDEHGWPQGFPRLGSEPVDYAVVQQLRTQARQHRPA